MEDEVPQRRRMSKKDRICFEISIVLIIIMIVIGLTSRAVL